MYLELPAAAESGGYFAQQSERERNQFHQNDLICFAGRFYFFFPSAADLVIKPKHPSQFASLNVLNILSSELTNRRRIG